MRLFKIKGETLRLPDISYALESVAVDLVLPADLEKRVNEIVARGEFASREQSFEEAAELLLGMRQADQGPVPVNEHWHERVDALVEEAQASGEATEMTDQDWKKVERSGLTLLRARKKAKAHVARTIVRPATRRDLIQHFVYIGENGSLDAARASCQRRVRPPCSSPKAHASARPINPPSFLLYGFGESGNLKAT